MTQPAKRPSTATRRTGGSQPTLNGHGPGEQDLRGDQELVGDRDRDDGYKRDDRIERDERDSRDEQSDQRARREQDARREDRADDRDDRSERVERDSRDEQRTERGEQDDGVQRTVEQVTDRVRAATSNPGPAFALTPDMSKVVTAWFDVAGDMMKLQQQFFTSMLGAGNTNDRTTRKV